MEMVIERGFVGVLGGSLHMGGLNDSMMSLRAGTVLHVPRSAQMDYLQGLERTPGRSGCTQCGAAERRLAMRLIISIHNLHLLARLICITLQWDGTAG